MQQNPAARAEAKLVFYDEGDFPGTGSGREAIVLEYPRDTGVAHPATHAITGQGKFESHNGPWAWQRASPLTLNAEVRQAVRRVAERAQAAFAARDADFFLTFGEPYFTEYARAYPGITAQQRIERFRRGLSPREGEPPWRVAALEPAAFDLRLCADGHVIELIDQDFKPIVRGESRFYPFVMFVGVVDGRLRMLR